MTNGLIGRKLGMTRVFAEDGSAVPVTVIEAGPCRVVQVRTGAVQLGFGARRAQRTTRAALGHAQPLVLHGLARAVALGCHRGQLDLRLGQAPAQLVQ